MQNPTGIRIIKKPKKHRNNNTITVSPLFLSHNSLEHPDKPQNDIAGSHYKPYRDKTVNPALLHPGNGIHFNILLQGKGPAVLDHIAAAEKHNAVGDEIKQNLHRLRHPVIYD